MGIFDVFNKKPAPAPVVAAPPPPAPAPKPHGDYLPITVEVLAGKDALRKAISPYVAGFIFTDSMYEEIAYKVILAAGRARGNEY